MHCFLCDHKNKKLKYRSQISYLNVNRFRFNGFLALCAQARCAGQRLIGYTVPITNRTIHINITHTNLAEPNKCYNILGCKASFLFFFVFFFVLKLLGCSGDVVLVCECIHLRICRQCSRFLLISFSLFQYFFFIRN